MPASARRAPMARRPDRVGPTASSTKLDAPPSARAKPPGSVDPSKPKPEAKILFQTYFKSVGPRTYAAQVKEAGNGNQFLVLTEGKRDDASGDVRKTRVFVFSEDFVAFFKLLKETAQFLKTHPVSEEVREKRRRYWARQNGEAPKSAAPRGRGRR